MLLYDCRRGRTPGRGAPPGGGRAPGGRGGAVGVPARSPAARMTLVLALRCRDGVVLASDGQATSEAAGQPTRQPVGKLFDVGGRIAWGAAGSVGLQQALADALSA